jgi:hypothetical protein
MAFLTRDSVASQARPSAPVSLEPTPFGPQVLSDDMTEGWSRGGKGENFWHSLDNLFMS